MLQIRVPAIELFDESTNEFINVKEQTLQLEHSLVSLSKWESKWKKPFLGKGEKTTEETIDYIRCMTITKNVKPETYLALTQDNFDQINAYISDPMTATTFSEHAMKRGPSRNRIITAEIIYYWMITFNIPTEYQKWHLNRLLTLIRVCELENAPPKKRSKKDIMSEYAALNAARRKQLNSRG